MRIVVRGRRAGRHSHRERPAREFDRAVAEFFMRLALTEAGRGLGRTSPNPAVGAVLVKNGHVIARGFHARAGSPHAEVVALRRAGERARGADLYVTLEPCNHQGRTPPCTDAILQAGVRRVFVGCEDQNPIVSGRGIRRLRRAGVPVITGVLEKECLQLNRPFFTFITERRPFVTLKVAATADGRIATANGDSRWVTGERSRERVHRLRDQVDAILVGAKTVREDDPQLTARPRGRLAARQPLRVVLSASLDLPAWSRVFDRRHGSSLVLTACADAKKARRLSSKGIEVVVLPGSRGKVDLGAALAELHQRDVVHLLVDAYTGLLEDGLADDLWLFIAPKILGGGRSWAPMAPEARMDRAMALGEATVERVGEDVLLQARLPKGRGARRA